MVNQLVMVSTQPSKKVFITKPTEDDIDDFYKELFKCEGKPAVYC